MDRCRIKSCRVAGLTRLAHRVPSDRRRSWALANLLRVLLTTTLARLPIAEMIREIRLGVIGVPV